MKIKLEYFHELCFFSLEPCLSIQMHSVDVYEKDNQLSLIKTFRTEDELIGDGEKRTAK